MNILFRGKRKDNHEWAYGYIIQEPNGRSFIGTYLPGGMWDWVEVEAETVGVYTGTSIENATKIFSGDIIATTINDGAYKFCVEYDKCGGVQNCDNYGYMGFHLVPWDAETKRCARHGLRDDLCYWLVEHDMSVIGNRWDGVNNHNLL